MEDNRNSLNGEVNEDSQLEESVEDFSYLSLFEFPSNEHLFFFEKWWFIVVLTLIFWPAGLGLLIFRFRDPIILALHIPFWIARDAIKERREKKALAARPDTEPDDSEPDNVLSSADK